jgi:hypothetical protein
MSSNYTSSSKEIHVDTRGVTNPWSLRRFRQQVCRKGAQIEEVTAYLYYKGKHIHTLTGPGAMMAEERVRECNEQGFTPSLSNERKPSRSLGEMSKEQRLQAADEQTPPLF